jgi:carbonic anhydrase
MTARLRTTVALALSMSAGLIAASDPPLAMPGTTGGLTPAAALGQLKAGNDRFARNASRPVSLSVNRRKEVLAAQHPMAIVLTCADSRVPPELIFNTGLGDLFVVRTEGGVIDRAILATIEHGADRLHAPLLIVMGHEQCDAVKAAAETISAPASPNMEYLVRAIQAARRPAPADDHMERTGADRDAITTLILNNVEQVINDALGKSPALRAMVDDGRLSVVGAYYEMVSGRVVFSEPLGGDDTNQDARH